VRIRHDQIADALQPEKRRAALTRAVKKRVGTVPSRLLGVAESIA
jgi:hypothetical protein